MSSKKTRTESDRLNHIIAESREWGHPVKFAMLLFFEKFNGVNLGH